MEGCLVKCQKLIYVPHRWIINGEREHTLGDYINGLWKSCVSWNETNWGIMKYCKVVWFLIQVLCLLELRFFPQSIGKGAEFKNITVNKNRSIN